MPMPDAVFASPSRAPCQTGRADLYQSAMPAPDLKPRKRARLTIAVAVLGLHVAAIVALVAAFAPSLGDAALRPVLQAVNVTLATPSPPPPPPPAPRPSPSNAVAQAQGAAAPPAKKARPREVAAPAPRIVIATPPAPPIAGEGAANRAGTSAAGAGTGAVGIGQGTGAGGSGTGTGGGGGAVTIALTVGADGRPTACRIVGPSRDPEADRITCDLATSRFRFRPARNAAGEPVASIYGWQQRWFTPERN